MKAAISLATVVLEDAGTRQQVEAKCKAFKTAFKDKPLSLTYEIWDDLAPTPAEVPIPANAESATYDGRTSCCSAASVFAKVQSPIEFPPSTPAHQTLYW